MNFICLVFLLLIFGLNTFAEEAPKKIYKINAETMTYGSVEDYKFKTKKPNVDFNFSVFGTNIELKGFTEEKSKTFYADELEKNYSK